MAGKADISAKVGLEGEKELNKALKDANAGLKALSSEAKMVASNLDSETTAEQKAAKQAEVLNKQIQAQKDKLKLLQEGLQKAKDNYGETDEKTQKWQKSVYDTQTAINKLEKELQGSNSELKKTDANVDEVKDSMTDAEKETKSWGDVMKGSLAAEAVKAGLTKLVDLTKQAASALKDCAESGAVYGDEMITLSQKTGLSTKTLQQYEYMSGLVDVSLDTISGALTKTQKSMVSATKGTGDAYEAYKELGVNVTDANGKLRSSEDVFNDLIDALGKVDNETERDTMAMSLMGKSAKELNPLIKTGVDRLNDYKKEAEDVGYVLSNKDLKALQQAKDAMDRFDKSVESCKNQFSVGLAPALEESRQMLADKLNSPQVQRALKDLSESLGEKLVKAAEFASKAIDFVVKGLDFLDGSISQMTDKDYELITASEKVVDATKDVHGAYEENAGAILGEKKRTEELWKELQDLCDEEGNVTDADADRAQLILGKLNHALGTEYEMTGNQIRNYQEMQHEIDELIKKKTALALQDAHAEEYSNALDNVYKTRELKAKAEMEKLQAWNDYIQEYNKLSQMFTRYNSKDIGLKERIQLGKDIYEESLVFNGLGEKVDEYDQKVKDLTETEEQLTRTISREEAAQQAILEGRYEDATAIYAKDITVMQDYSTKRGKITEEQVEEMKASLDVQEQMIKDYQKSLEEGREGYNQKELDDMQAHYNETQSILDQYGKGVENWGDLNLLQLDKVQKGMSATEYGVKLATDGVNWAINSVDMSKLPAEADKARAGTETAVQETRRTVRATIDGIVVDLQGESDAFYEQAYLLGKQLSLGTGQGVSDWTSSVVNGMRSMVQQACIAARQEAQINSPSKVTMKIGQGLGEGVVVGMDKEEAAVKAASQRMADAAMSGDYNSSGWVSSSYGFGGTSSSYTTNMGGITLYVSGAGVQNVDQLADRVATKLTQQLRRAQRAR